MFRNTQDCILTRRSVRKFTNEPVAPETVEQVVSLAAFAPSWKNTQVSRYLAVIEPEDRAQICQYVPDYNACIIDQCSVLLAQTFVKSRSGYERDGSFSTDRGPGWQYYDCGIAAQTLCLAAHDMGLGTVIMGVFDRPALERFLNIPADQELMALIALGYPDETQGRTDIIVLQARTKYHIRWTEKRSGPAKNGRSFAFLKLYAKWQQMDVTKNTKMLANLVKLPVNKG